MTPAPLSLCGRFMSRRRQRNLAAPAHTRAGTEQMADQPIFRPAIISGLNATLDVCQEVATGKSAALFTPLRQLLQAPRPTLSSVRGLSSALTLPRPTSSRQPGCDPTWSCDGGEGLRKRVPLRAGRVDYLAPWIELPPAPQAQALDELKNCCDVSIASRPWRRRRGWD